MTSNLTEAVQKIAELSGEEQDFFARFILDQLALRARDREKAAVASREDIFLEQVKRQRSSIRVLVVDDEDFLLEFTRKCLELSGFTVLVAGGGAAAIQVLEELAEPVDLLLADCNMPDMSGPELIEAVVKRWPTVKFVLTSGFLTDANHARVEPYGVGILEKPYGQQDITRVIYEMLAE